MGHSFVRRMKRGIVGVSSPFRDNDITKYNRWDGQSFARDLGIVGCFDSAYTLSNNVNVFQDLPHNFRTSCELMVFCLGSNDLAQLKSANVRAVMDIVKKHFNWAQSSGAKHILFIGVIPRVKRINGTVADFEFNRLHYNAYLKLLCRTPMNTSFSRIRGFEGGPDRQPMSVYRWSNDGIHPAVWDRYLLRFRHAIITAANVLK